MHQETSSAIKLVNEYGNQRFVCQQGRMSITKHQSVLLALEKRALSYRRKNHLQVDNGTVLYENALDETGTVSTAESGEANFNSQTIADEYTKRIEMEGV